MDHSEPANRRIHVMQYAPLPKRRAGRARLAGLVQPEEFLNKSVTRTLDVSEERL